MTRFYYRCTTCLSVFVLEQRKDNLYCGHCETILYFMGAVVRDSRVLTKEVEETPCDQRCTHALGPVCNCKCGGVNHGSGHVIISTKVLGKEPTPNNERMERNFRWADWLLSWKERTLLAFSFYNGKDYFIARRHKAETYQILSLQTWNSRFKLVEKISEFLKLRVELPEDARQGVIEEDKELDV